MTGLKGRAWEGGLSQGECALKVPRRRWGRPLSCLNSVAQENVGVSSRARRLWAESATTPTSIRPHHPFLLLYQVFLYDSVW